MRFEKSNVATFKLTITILSLLQQQYYNYAKPQKKCCTEKYNSQFSLHLYFEIVNNYCSYFFNCL